MAGEVFMPCPDGPAFKLWQKALKRVRKMDEDDRRSGDMPPQYCPLDLHLRNTISALVCAMQTKDWKVAAEALVMLQDAELRVRTAADPQRN